MLIVVARTVLEFDASRDDDFARARFNRAGGFHARAGFSRARGFFAGAGFNRAGRFFAGARNDFARARDNRTTARSFNPGSWYSTCPEPFP